MIRIEYAHGLDTAIQPALAALLQDSVHGGASIGFLAPLDEHTASEYWQELAANLGPLLHCWLAFDGEQLIGTVQLAQCGKANGRHRGEIQKLMVHSLKRGQGIARQLMLAAEQFARTQGCTLLVLDTDSQSAAATIYPHLCWLHAGDIPDYALMPDGRLHTTRYFYKPL